MTIRPMTIADAAFAAVLTARTPQAAAWSAADYAALLAQAGTARSFGQVFELAVSGPTELDPAGFLIGRIIADEAEILNVAVEPAARRRGAGRGLVQAAIAQALAAGARRIFLEVRETNQAARRLYASEGFHEVARRAGYYHSPTEDALVLEKSLAQAAG